MSRIETPRLILRNFTPEDADAAFVWLSDPRVNEFMPYPLYTKVEDAKAWCQYVSEDKDEIYERAILVKETKEVIGGARIRWVEERKSWTFGYNIAFAHWGHGYATETALALMDFARKEKAAHVFEASAAVENQMSIRVIKKCGLSFFQEEEYSKFDGSRTFKANIYRREE